MTSSSPSSAPAGLFSLEGTVAWVPGGAGALGSVISLGLAQHGAHVVVSARVQEKAEAVAQGIWPPKGGPAHLTTNMVSTIALPTAVSPLK